MSKGFVVVMRRPLRILHQRTVVRGREQNVPQTTLQRGSTLKVKTPEALIRNEMKTTPLPVHWSNQSCMC